MKTKYKILIGIAIVISLGLIIFFLINKNFLSPSPKIKYIHKRFKDYRVPDIKLVQKKIKELVQKKIKEENREYNHRVLYMTYHTVDDIPLSILENIKKSCKEYVVEIHGNQSCEDFLYKYYVHKVNSAKEANALLAAKRYSPVYVQDFVAMKADIRVMVIGHKPVCAFWRRPPKGGWLTNTSQGGRMDYQKVPEGVLALATRASKLANADYWACDIAVGKDKKYHILECATAFAAFPYIRDWIGQYLMWKLSEGKFQKPNIPLYNWEELGKIKSPLLRTMRHIAFSQYTASQDSGELFSEVSDADYPILNTHKRDIEEWPSEIWNHQSHRDGSDARGRRPSRPSDHTCVSARAGPGARRRRAGPGPRIHQRAKRIHASDRCGR